MNDAIAVFGGMNMDILGVSSKKLVARDSNIGRVQLRPGGVGRNIAERIAESGAKALLITVLGTGHFAEILARDCESKRIDLAFALRADAPCPTYLAIHGNDGDMALAVNDMEALDNLTEEAIASILPLLPPVSCGIIDANLNEGALRALAESAPFPLVADPVSVEKARRLFPILGRLYAVKPNLLEAMAMTGKSSPGACAEALLDRGVKQVFISMGQEGVWYADGNVSGRLPARSFPHGDLTGAGDAMCAGLALAARLQMDVRSAAMHGQSFAEQYLTRKSFQQ